ncbi:MAG: type II CAAX endopeptidase family protein [Candidatus Promineifilaceae bacterium]|nr:type II CAAX endopeptidase family protein [Candidatus Promineifilaceae bacterium]
MELVARNRPGMTLRTLGPFLALSFGLTWGLVVLYLSFTDKMIAIFGEIGMANPLFILAVYAPGFAGLLLVWWHYGLKGVGSFLQRLTLWRAPRLWWMFLILGIPAIFYIAAAVKGTTADPFPFSPWTELFPALALALILGPIEEFGWRGLALPLLQRRFAPFWAGLILGVIWATWHIPSFLMGGTPQSTWSFGPYFLGIVAISVILTPFFNASRGSLLVAVLYHFQMMNPMWPDAQPWDSVFFIIVAVIVVWLNRQQMFKKGTGTTDVLMSDVQTYLNH